MNRSTERRIRKLKIRLLKKHHSVQYLSLAFPIFHYFFFSIHLIRNFKTICNEHSSNEAHRNAQHKNAGHFNALPLNA